MPDITITVDVELEKVKELRKELERIKELKEEIQELEEDEDDTIGPTDFPDIDPEPNPRPNPFPDRKYPERPRFWAENSTLKVDGRPLEVENIEFEFPENNNIKAETSFEL